MKRLYRFAALLFGVALLSYGARAETLPVGQPVYGMPTETTVQTLTAQGAATVNSVDQVAYGRGLYCTFNMTAHTGTPSTTFAVQLKDGASASYRSAITSAAVVADATPTSLLVYPGAQTTSLPANVTGISMPITYKWRIQAVVSGTSPQVTATVGCSIIP